jgi:flagellar basal body-associated protein FliL
MSKTEDQAIHEMIAAFAIGCMDKANYMQFKDYLSEGSELPKGELGELQNIISMIPIILDLEVPNTTIKDKVAKRLIGMKEEIKTKIFEDKKRSTRPLAKTAWIDPPSAQPSVSFSGQPKKEDFTFGGKKAPTGTSAFQFGDDQVPSIFEKDGQKKAEQPLQQKESDSIPKRMEQIPEPESSKSLFQSKRAEQEKPVQQEKVSSGAVGWIAILITIILFSIIGYYTFSTTESLRRQVEDLKSDVTVLRTQQATANNFIANYTSLIEFFYYKDIVVYNLVSSEVNEKASAQLLISFNEKEGLIQFKNAKMLPPDQSFQVWAVSKGQAYSIGSYQPMGSEYIKITSFPFLPKEKIDSFKVTLEQKDGAQFPSAKIYLTYSQAGNPLHGKAR